MNAQHPSGLSACRLIHLSGWQRLPPHAQLPQRPGLRTVTSLQLTTSQGPTLVVQLSADDGLCHLWCAGTTDPVLRQGSVSEKVCRTTLDILQ